MSREYPPDWDKRRKKVYERDQYTCVHCGEEGGTRGNAELHAHHIVPKGRGGSHNTSNLVTLCNKCHDAVHNSNSNPRSPKGTGSLNYSSIDEWGILADKIISDIGETVRKPANQFDGITPQTPPRKIRDIVRSTHQETSSNLLRIMEGIGRLDELSTKNYSSKLVKVNQECNDSGVEILQEYLEYFDDMLESLEEGLGAMRKCPACDATIHEDMDFCGNCGSEIEIFPSCPGCGMILGELSEYCVKCGESLEQVEFKEAPTKFREFGELTMDLADYTKSAIPEYNSKIKKRDKVVQAN